MPRQDLDSSFGFLLHDIARLMRKRFDQRARGLGLTRAQWQVLAHLARHEGISQAGLADIIEIKPITLGRLIDRMAEAGWVERRAHHSDRRVRQLYLTAKAEPVFARMRALADETRAEALAGLSQGERERLTATLVGIRSNLSDRNHPNNGTALVTEKPVTKKPVAGQSTRGKRASNKTVSNEPLADTAGTRGDD